MVKYDIRLRVSSLIRQLDYPQIRLRRLDIDKLRNWCNTNLPKAVEKFKRDRFDLNEATTWEEIAAYNTVLQIYGRKVAVYFTFGWLEYQAVKEFIQSKKGAKFRQDFGLDCHSAILLSPQTFFSAESLDEFWVSFDFAKGYNFLDYSHYNEDDDLDSDDEKYQWLNEALSLQENEKIKNPYEEVTPLDAPVHLAKPNLKMSLLPTTRKYTRPQPQPDLLAVGHKPPTLIGALEEEEYDLQHQLNQIEEAKSLEHGLRLRLNVVQQSLQAFRALEAVPEPVQEQQTPVPVVKNVRKAATKKAVTPTQRSITVSDTENINLVHDDFATFPE